MFWFFLSDGLWPHVNLQNGPWAKQVEIPGILKKKKKEKRKDQYLFQYHSKKEKSPWHRKQDFFL